MVTARTAGRRGGVRRLTGADAEGAGHRATIGDWAQGFAVALAQDDPRSGEQLARAMFEGAPAPVRRLLEAGWRLVLGLRLLPAASDRAIVGWAISSSTDEEVVLTADSRLLTAVKIVRRDGPELIATTSVRYESKWGRLVWPVVLPAHLVIEPYLLGRAARSHRASGAG
nr:DUF2867 domain-containing protein [Allobranchiibius huperziae]